MMNKFAQFLPLRYRRSSAAFFFLTALGLVVVLGLSGAASGVNGFDEPIQYLGLTSVLEHGKDVLSLKNPDFNDIHSNLEFYGIAPRLPAYVLWQIVKVIRKVIDPFGDLGISTYSGDGLRQAYRSSFFAIAHMVSVGYLIGTALIVSQASRRLAIPNPEFAGVMTLLFPALLGFSLISVKDTAFAFFYSLYSYMLASVWQQRLSAGDQAMNRSAWRLLCGHGCVTGLLASIYASSLFVILVSEVLLALLFHRATRRSAKISSQQLGVFLVVVAVSWFILSPPAWQDPLRFFIASLHYSLDGAQAWGGCMHFFNTCPRRGEDWSAWIYLKNWLFSTMPLLHLFGLMCALAFVLAELKKLLLVARSPSMRWQFSSCSELRNPFLWAFVLQALLIPAALILNNGFIYDGTRHVLFLLPPLTLFSYSGLARVFSACLDGIRRVVFLVPVGIMSLLLMANLFLLHPYQYTYFNELALARGINWKNTDLDFYYASDAESLRNFMQTERFQAFASDGGLDIKGSPSLEHAYLVERFPRRPGHPYFFTNHTREPGVALRKDCKQEGKSVYRQQLFGPVNIYGTPQICLASSYRDWDPF